MKNENSFWPLLMAFCLWAVFCPVFATNVSLCLLEDSALWADTLASVGIEASFRKEAPINPLIYGSGRSFSTEDAYHYAGSLGDVGRMVRNYAGVACPDDSRNDISIRGNSPSHLLWRIDGYEIANPNHFSSIGLTGSTVSLLNTNLITNSDFLTGAFPAEYGNALSGVFDLHLRPAAEDYLFRVQTGWNGFELGAEGPFRKRESSMQKDSSGYFQAAYRYSFLDLLGLLGMDTGLRPKYQDFTLKLSQDFSARWSLSALALWGISRLDLAQDSVLLSTGSVSKFLGLCLAYDDEGCNKASLRLYWNGSLCHSSIGGSERLFDEKNGENRYSLSLKWENRSWLRHYWQLGVGLDMYDMDFSSPTSSPASSQKGLLSLAYMYAQDEYRFSERWKMRLGGRLQAKDLEGNVHAKIEPRAALQWRINDRHRLALAYGCHHQTQVHTLYLYEEASCGEDTVSNRALDFSSANHYCLSYDWYIAPLWRFKSDVYYQCLSDIPVEKSQASAYSALNMGADFYIPLKAGLVNEGKGRNYGVELTLERFLDNRYYAMANVHFFRSLYTGSDGIWRSSSYDVCYTVNVVAGYQFPIGMAYLLGVDAKLSASGGKPATPLGGEFHSGRYPPYFRSDLRLFCQYRAPRCFYEFAVDLQNLTNHKNLLYEVYRPESKQYTYYYQTLFSPMYTFRVLF